MIIIEILLLIVAASFCVYSSITDLKYSIIPNRAVVLCGCICVVLSIIYYGFFCRDCVYEYLINCATLAVFAILFYALHIWGAGDSKMLILLAVATPARLYFHFGNELISLLAVVIFTFSFGYIFLVAQSFTYMLNKKKEYRAVIDKFAIIDFIKGYFIGAVYLNFLINILVRAIPEFYSQNRVLFLFINVFIVMLIFSITVFQKRWLIALCFAADVVLAISGGVTLVLTDFWIYIVIAVLFVMRQIISRYNYKEILVSELKPGMILAATNVVMMSTSNIANLPSGITEDLRCKLSPAEVDAVKKWTKRRNGMQSIITIVCKIPFAVFITLGYILYVVLGILK